MAPSAAEVRAFITKPGLPRPSSSSSSSTSSSLSSSFKGCSAGPLSVKRGSDGRTAQLIRLLSTGQRAHPRKTQSRLFFLFFLEIHHAGSANEDTRGRQAGNLPRVLGGGEPEGPALSLGLSAFKSRAAQGELLLWQTCFKTSRSQADERPAGEAEHAGVTPPLRLDKRFNVVPDIIVITQSRILPLVAETVMEGLLGSQKISSG
ncbi:unnamed protein product [Pleuronectes platessa]|uniref:Uncharacterized protein n=1 Tax=Pleuronectes platessa TaxID=8262 RepID=A0A9N7VT05_PLEPL|nr:unnamed protein product [Pleuronectes platessa]